jgi:ribosome biogenesis GTPase
LIDRGLDRLVSLGWSERVAALFEEARAVVPGRVSRAERAASVVATSRGTVMAATPGPVAVGDWVGLTAGDDARVAFIAPRWSALTREDPSGRHPQVLAANIDVVLVVAPGDRLHASRVERELVVAWNSGAQPIVVLTKGDLTTPDAAKELQRRLVGADVIVTSSVTGAGIEDVADALRPDGTAVLLGPSGAGKSTLANALLGEDAFAIGDVRQGDRRGRHTTTSRCLLPLPTGGVIIDTPGLRSLGLAGDDGGVSAAFADIEELAGECRFGDCRHAGEPGCAVAAAAAEGSLDQARLASFKKLQREVAFQETRVDPRAREESLRKWKAITKANRARSRG